VQGRGRLSIREGEVYRYVATFAHEEEYFTLLKQLTFVPGRGTVAGRTALEGKAVHIADLAADPEYTGPTISLTIAKTRTALGVPLLRDGVVIGTLTLARRRVEPFSERQIELVQTFADQEVIAIENTRLFNETKEALERQTDRRGSESDRLFAIGLATGVRGNCDAINAVGRRPFCGCVDFRRRHGQSGGVHPGQSRGRCRAQGVVPAEAGGLSAV